jgi:hypothetical protein
MNQVNGLFAVKTFKSHVEGFNGKFGLQCLAYTPAVV